MKIVLATGGFDPIHKGHIQYLRDSKRLGDILYVGLNSDEWLVRKKGSPFMNWENRASIIQELKCVDYVIGFDDSDNSSINAIKMLLQIYPNDDIIFVNGGDRNKENIPEMIFPEVSFVFGVGGTNKIESSSSLLREWKEPKVNRSWGHYRTLYNTDGTKVKELTINPNSKLSVQKHFKRNEYWHVVEGEIIAQSFMENGYALPPVNLHPHDSYVVKVGEWHTLDNPTDKYVKMIEIQYGQECIEDDIVRK